MNEQEHEQKIEQAREVMLQWLLQREQGEDPDLVALCHGDQKLESLAQRLIERDEALFDGGSRKQDPKFQQHLNDLRLSEPVLGDFRLLDIIGRGGMGVVFCARQESLGRLVALKVLTGDRLGLERSRLRFQREAEVAASLEHPHIVPVIAIGVSAGCTYIAMKLLSGPGLNDLAKPLEPKSVAQIGLAIADALEAAHSAGIVHRDVKPANILFDGQQACLVDFGLARSESDSTVTQTHSVPGTVPYMPPEQFSGERKALDPRQDVYSLGATLYELLSGFPPFRAPATPALIQQILFSEPRALKLKGSERDLSVLISRCLEKEPSKRIQTAGRLRDELQRFLSGRPIEVRPVAYIERIWRRVTKHPRKYGFAALLAVVLLGLSVALAAAKLREERHLESQLEEGYRVLDEREWPRALSLAEELVKLRPSDHRIVAFQSKAQAAQALEILLQTVQNRVGVGSQRELRDALQGVSEVQVVDLNPGVLALGRCLAHWLLNEPELASLELKQAQEADISNWTMAQFQSLLEPTKQQALASEVGDVDNVEELVLSATAMLLQSRPVGAQLEVIRRARSLDGIHRRARILEAMIFATGQQTEQARSLFTTLRAELPENVSVRRNLIELLILSQDFETATQELEQMPRSQWSVIERYLDLSLTYARGDQGQLSDKLDQHRSELGQERAQDAIYLSLFEAYLAQLRGDYAEAQSLFETILASWLDPLTREHVVARFYQLKVDRVLNHLDQQVNLRDRLEQLVEEGQRTSLTAPRATGAVAWKLGMAQLTLGQVSAGFANLEQAMELLPASLGPRIQYVRSAISLGESLPSMPDREQFPPGTSDYLFQQALAVCREALDAPAPPEGSTTAAQRLLLISHYLKVAKLLGDWQGIVQHADDLSDSLESQAERDALNEFTKTHRALFDWFYVGPPQKTK